MKNLLQNKRRLAIICSVLGILVLAVGVGLGLAAAGEGYTLTTYSMGSFVQQTVYGKNREEAASTASSAVTELEDLISRNVADSDIIRLNQAAGTEFLEIDQRTWDVLDISLQVCRASEGAFDITIGPISGLWGFDTQEPHLPQDSTIQSLLPMVDYENLSLLEDSTAALQIHGAALDLGAVGKGAGCDAAIAAYQEAGADRAIVSVGGSVGVYGQKPGGQPWRIAVRDPDSDGSLGELAIYEGFLSTSGSYEKTFTQDGVTYHHILDPRTGYPADSGLLSVTVWSSGGALSDALSTACFVLGMEDSLPLLEEFDCGAIFITEEHEVYVTENLQDAFTLAADGYTLAGAAE